ncbi:flagellar biosynthetic protein FliO [Altererythrobacter sp. H2]|uniref:flagellar biosynthetic protein FliO n=1 Tax=Altererythrobacter sp. H2 TaxID=3108391 RepID=UPI000BC39B93|nr:flagellar biosynthetic protein FliO [Altererythrobacter sp. H2]OZA94181.1 MAG: flagellar biogenesis protein [Erythrobacter sp. 34-65-8]WRK96961.1 flagellar biosynthetic protein FliO [Altererythrobacter sp. H2]
MGWYLAKMLLLVPLLGLMIWGSLKLTQRVQQKLTGANAGRVQRARLVETTFLGPGLKLAVVEFRGREILLGCTRNGLTRLADVPTSEEHGQ